MNKKIDLEILLKFIEDGCSEAEKNEVELWLNSSESNRKELEEIKKLWSVPPLPVPEPDTEEALFRVKKRIELNEIRNKSKEQTHSISLWEFIEKHLFNPAYIKAAAIIVFIFAFYFVFNNITETKINTITVAESQIKELVLPDGSKINLDSGSRFNYPQEFAEDSRNVYLSGEGYFEVKPDPLKPFIITTDAGEVKVLGTKFNLRTWESKAEVTVLEGKVSLASVRSEYKDSTVVISGGYKSSLGSNGLPTAPRGVNPNESTAWFNREMKFDSVPLSIVLGQLERWYALDIHLPSDELNNDSVTVYLENKPIEDILDMLSLVMNLDYKVNGSQVQFSNKQ